MEFIYLLTPCFVSFAADGVGPRNVVGSKLLKLLIFIFFCREQCWRSGIVVCVVVNTIILLVLSVVVSTRI